MELVEWLLVVQKLGHVHISVVTVKDATIEISLEYLFWHRKSRPSELTCFTVTDRNPEEFIIYNRRNIWQ